MTIENRRQYVQTLLEDHFYTRKEAVKKLAEVEGIQEQSAQTFVYSVFGGPRYSDYEILKRARKVIQEQ